MVAEALADSQSGAMHYDRNRLLYEIKEILDETSSFYREICDFNEANAEDLRQMTFGRVNTSLGESAGVQSSRWQEGLERRRKRYLAEWPVINKRVPYVRRRAFRWLNWAVALSPGIRVLIKKALDCIDDDPVDGEDSTYDSLQYSVGELLDSLHVARQTLTDQTWDIADAMTTSDGAEEQIRRRRGPKPDEARHTAILGALNSACRGKDVDPILVACESLDEDGLPFSGKIIRKGSLTRNAPGGWAAAYQQNANNVRSKMRKTLDWASSSNRIVNGRLCPILCWTPQPSKLFKTPQNCVNTSCK